MHDAALRLKLRRLLDALPGIVEPAFGRSPILPGTVYYRSYRCGRPTCHCREGERHRYLSINLWGKGKADVFSIPPQEERRLREMTNAYRRLREARAEVGRWCQQVTQLMDELQALRLYPDDQVPRGTGSRRGKRSAGEGKEDQG
jgi:hypothetical protein